jgi:hypothetical protein
LWNPDVVWGSTVVSGSHVIWGANTIGGDHIVWGFSSATGFHIVWGAHVIWGSATQDAAESTEISIYGER